MKTNIGQDHQAQAMADPAADSGTATSTTATTLVDTTKSWTTNAWTGKLVVAGGVLGIVLSNTATTLTIDKWTTPSNPGGAAAATPAGTTTYTICPGQAPAFWMALTENATAPAATDTTLAGELSGSGWSRIPAVFAHSAGVASYTLTKTFTSSDASPRTPAKVATFGASSAGRMPFEAAIPTPAAMLSGDTQTLTQTVNM